MVVKREHRVHYRSSLGKLKDHNLMSGLVILQVKFWQWIFALLHMCWFVSYKNYLQPKKVRSMD